MDTRRLMEWLSLPLAAAYAAIGLLSIALFLLPDLELEIAGLAYGGDLMLGLVFLVVAGIFAAASRLLLEGDPEQLSFAYVGSGMATLILAIQAIMVISGAIVAALGGEPWALGESLHPSALVGLVALAAFLSHRGQMGSDDCPVEAP